MEEKQPYQFTLDDPEWENYLLNNGYVVIKSVASPEEIEKAKDLFWKHFEEKNKVKRDDFTTWENWNTDRRGILTNAVTIQSEGAWFIRGLPKVKSAFQKIWKTDDLIVSMDSLIMWKPWWLDPPKWLPRTEGLHVDQNPFQKPDRVCVQGMVTLLDVTKDIGGLEIVPKSHLPESQEKIRKAYPHIDKQGDFVMIRPNNKEIIKERKLLLAEAGDLILWDSRTIHGGWVGKGGTTTRENPSLSRLAMTVCMLPRSTASEHVLELRKEGYEKGYGFSHWANEAHMTSQTGPGYKPAELTPEQLALL